MKTTIDDESNVHTLINTFSVLPEMAEAIVDALRRFTNEYAREQPGFISASVHTSSDSRKVVNYAQWEKPEDLRRMLLAPVAQAHMAELHELAENIEPVFYRVAYVAARGLSLS